MEKAVLRFGSSLSSGNFEILYEVARNRGGIEFTNFLIYWSIYDSKSRKYNPSI